MFACLCVLSHARNCAAQAAPAATGLGSFLSFGAAASSFQQQGDERYSAGGTAYVDANVFPRIGFEVEFQYHAAQSGSTLQQESRLVGLRLTGPRIQSARNLFRPYLKLLTGTVAFVPGGGLDMHLAESRLTIRLADVEYQFPTGRPRAFGLTTGLAFDVFGTRSRPGGRHF